MVGGRSWSPGNVSHLEWAWLVLRYDSALSAGTTKERSGCGGRGLRGRGFLGGGGGGIGERLFVVA